jgi:hypothetical protein
MTMAIMRESPIGGAPAPVLLTPRPTLTSTMENPMTKAGKKATTQKQDRPDAHLLEMIRRDHEIWTEWDLLDEKDSRVDALSTESTELEREILVTPAFTADGLAGKRRIVERAELSAWDDLEIIDVIFRLDAERIAAR